MQCSTCGKNTLYERISPKLAFFFDDSHYLGATDGVLHPYSNTGNVPVEFFFFVGELLSPGLLDGLYYRYRNGAGCYSACRSSHIHSNNYRGHPQNREAGRKTARDSSPVKARKLLGLSLCSI